MACNNENLQVIICIDKSFIASSHNCLGIARWFQAIHEMVIYPSFSTTNIEQVANRNAMPSWSMLIMTQNIVCTTLMRT